MQLPISTAWMYLSDDQQYNTIPPEWSNINFKDVDVLNIGPAGVQADGAFGLYNTPQTGDLANRFKWVIQTARSQNPNIKIIVSQWWGNGDNIWGSALDSLNGDDAICAYTDSLIAFLASYLEVSGGIDGYDIDYEDNNIVESVTEICSQVRSGMDALSEAHGGRPFYLTVSPAGLQYLDTLLDSVNLVNMQPTLAVKASRQTISRDWVIHRSNFSTESARRRTAVLARLKKSRLNTPTIILQGFTCGD